MGAQGLLSCFKLLGDNLLGRPLVKADGDVDLIQFERALRSVAVEKAFGAVMQDLAMDAGVCIDKKVRNSLAVFLIERASDMLVKGKCDQKVSGVVAIALELAEPCLHGAGVDEWRLRAYALRSRLGVRLG